MGKTLRNGEWLTAGGYLAVVALGVVDYLVEDYSLLLFYLAPVALISWRQECRGAFFVSVLSGLARFVSDYESHSPTTFKPFTSLEDTALIFAVAYLVPVVKRLMAEQRGA